MVDRDNSARVTDNARCIAVLHVIVGFLLVCFGIADSFAGSWAGNIGMGIWTGMLVSQMLLSDICCLFKDAKMKRRYSLRKKKSISSLTWL